jgi:hypothetical protein
MGKSVKATKWKYMLFCMMLLALVGAQTLWAAENLTPDLLQSLVGDIPIPKATVQSFSVLFDRHRLELKQLVDAHQDLVWETLNVVIEFLPSLKTVAANGGQLRVNRKTYAKATSLLERCELLASPELAQDLREAKTLVDSRLKEGDQEDLIINLKE